LKGGNEHSTTNIERRTSNSSDTVRALHSLEFRLQAVRTKADQLPPEGGTPNFSRVTQLFPITGDTP
jgi:hypothetical protein